jgi:hypothetical protein
MWKRARRAPAPLRLAGLPFDTGEVKLAVSVVDSRRKDR